jgi:hypothetical protein
VRPRLVPYLFLSFRYTFDREFLGDKREREGFREIQRRKKRDRFRYLIHDNPTPQDRILFKDPLYRV